MSELSGDQKAAAWALVERELRTRETLAAVIEAGWPAPVDGIAVRRADAVLGAVYARLAEALSVPAEAWDEVPAAEPEGGHPPFGET